MGDFTPKHDVFAKVAETLKDLPVANIVGDVVQSAKDGKVTILTAETGSGKTLLANSMLADSVDEQVVVLVPRRFLAINAAETVAELAGVELGKEVGFAVGQQAGDKSQFSPKTKLLFATYGYALSSGLIDTAKVIVADEVHEAGVDTSLARALIHKRMEHDPSLKVVEMSATLNAKKQAAYWKDIAKTSIHHAEGKAFPCENRHVRPSQRSVEQTAIDLILNEGRKGIAIFRPGVGEVEETADKLREMCRQRGLTHVEVESIYGDMDMEERERAVKAPEEGNVKILVGTNVIESGVNIKWLDTGISDGKGKVPYYRDTGAEALVLEDLPQWRIIQQEGRVKRFTDGIFVLHSEMGMEGREEQQVPEIERVSMTRLVMQAAQFSINPLNLKYDAEVDKQRLLEAKEDLKRLQLVNDDWTLTGKGEYVANLPVGPEAGAMLCAAAPEIRGEAIELAAIVEVGGLRADYKLSHHMDGTSDIFDGFEAFKALGYEATEEECADMNVSWKRYNEAKGLIDDMRSRHHRGLGPQRVAKRYELEQALLHGSVNRLFSLSGHECESLLQQGAYYEIGNTSVARESQANFAVGYLREIPSMHGSRTIMQNVTGISRETFLNFAANRDDVLTDMTFHRGAKGRDSVTCRYFGQERITFDISKKPTKGLLKLIEPEYTEFRRRKGDNVAKWPDSRQDNKPQGIGNTHVQEARRELARAR